jgi:hypothetical protein
MAMKIQFRTYPVSDRLHGWKRLACRVQRAFRGTLVVDFGRVTLKFAN